MEVWYQEQKDQEESEESENNEESEEENGGRGKPEEHGAPCPFSAKSQLPGSSTQQHTSPHNHRKARACPSCAKSQ